MKVDELSQYGKILSGLPKEAMKKQKAIVFREIRKKFGLFGIQRHSVDRAPTDLLYETVRR